MAKKEERELDPTLYTDDVESRKQRGDFVILEDEDKGVEEDEETNSEEDDEGSGEEEEDKGGEEGGGDKDPNLDEEEEEENDEGEDGDTKDVRIPKSRLDQVSAQRDAERDRVKWLEDQLEKVLNNQPEPKGIEEEKTSELPPYDFNKAEEKYIELILEGESKDAARLRSEITQENTILMQEMLSVTKKEAFDSAKEVSQASVEDQRFEITVESFEQKHAFLDAESDDYNEEAVDTINALMTGLMQDGMSKSKALSKAVDRVSPLYLTSSKKESLGSTKGSKRSKAARSKATDTMKKQPPDTTTSVKGSKSGMDDVDINQVTDDQFRKMSKKELAIMRGDVV